MVILILQRNSFENVDLGNFFYDLSFKMKVISHEKSYLTSRSHISQTLEGNPLDNFYD